jgi:hypothetical protein
MASCRRTCLTASSNSGVVTTTKKVSRTRGC